jgi:hypothetical protein
MLATCGRTDWFTWKVRFHVVLMIFLCTKEETKTGTRVHCTTKLKVRLHLIVCCNHISYLTSHFYCASELQKTRQIKGFADSGFVGVSKQLTTTRNAHSKEMKELIARAKARQESFNSRMSRFNVLKSRFRHGKGTQKRLDLHKSCAEACCVIVHYGMENGSPLFDV